MLKTKVIEHFGKAKLVSMALGLSSGAVSQWPELIPEKQAMKLERLTKGKLKYDETLYQKDNAGAAA